MATRTIKSASEDADDTALSAADDNTSPTTTLASQPHGATEPPLTAPSNSPEPSPFIVDAYSGQGGSYVLDPETGIRTLVGRTLPPTL